VALAQIGIIEQDDGLPPRVGIIHVLPEAALQKAEAAYDAAMAADGEDADGLTAVDHVADMQFWLANAMPFQRGSAAISSWLAQSILETKTGTRPRFTASADLQAFMTADLDEYRTRYRTLFVPDARADAEEAVAGEELDEPEQAQEEGCCIVQ